MEGTVYQCDSPDAFHTTRITAGVECSEFALKSLVLRSSITFPR